MTLRRKAAPPPPTPERLRHFRPSDWPGSLSVEDALDAWRAARRSFARVNPGALGDAVDRIRAERAERRRAFR